MEVPPLLSLTGHYMTHELLNAFGKAFKTWNDAAKQLMPSTMTLCQHQ